PGEPWNGRSQPSGPWESTSQPGEPWNGTSQPGEPWNGRSQPSGPWESTSQPGEPWNSTSRPGGPWNSTSQPGEPWDGTSRPCGPWDGLSRVGVLLTGDEETGSVTSRELIEREARRSGAVLVLEPGTPEGALKIARKGGSVYRLHVQGRAAHAGVEPHRGVNAGVELAHQILAVRELAAPLSGTSVTPTALAGGTTTNTVPESAAVSVDVRSWTREELDRVDRAIRALPSRLPGARLTVEGGVNRYPLLSTVAQPLLEAAQAVAKQLGLPPPGGAHAPGASDGNFTGALGVPTLDGLGAVGGHPHARGEYIEVASLPDRTALLAGLVERLVAAPRGDAGP
ncbi:M20/M25/M40 family metallo-hydrolase, partial [Phytohabitans suffuscus]